MTIKHHYIKLGRNNLPFLEGKLRSLEPRETESMDSFLSRCEDMRGLYASYGQALNDTSLITQVLSRLSIHWQRISCLQSQDSDSWTWDLVSDALQLEDNERRLANWRTPDALLPLGWSKYKKGGEARAASGEHVIDSSPPSSPSGPQSYAAAAKGKGQGKGPKPGSPKTYGGPVVCYHCLKQGHVYVDPACPKFDRKWRPTEAQTAKAQEMRLKLKGKAPSPSSPPVSPITPGSPTGEGKVASSSA
jgi:hypothetical protein